MKNKVIKFLIILCGILIFCVVFLTKNNQKANEEICRLNNNQTTLKQKLKTWKDKDSAMVAQITVLKLRKAEFQTLYYKEAEQVKNLNIKLKHLQNYSETTLNSSYTIHDTIFDSIVIPAQNGFDIIDTLSCVNYKDDYIQMNGFINKKNVFFGGIQTFDTIISLVHIIPKKFLFFTYGVKFVDNTVVSKNPYSNITSQKCIQIEK
ncbi:MAG: hypothetical protein IJ759_07530 [Bacteroidales bacterium]|nr:hypothetical protein [Bacteroidales bacterium]